MDDYIRREKLIEHIEAHFDGCDNCGEVMHCALDTPTADVVPVRHGHWLNWSDFFQRETDKRLKLGVFCSACRMYADNKFNYCPNCGAKMDGGNKK